MPDNGNRRPNDFRSRNNRRRREPPIIDASATEVPLDPVDDPTTPEAEPTPAEPPADPVLFGGALRPAEAAAPPPPEPAAAVEESPAPERESVPDRESAPAEPSAPAPGAGLEIVPSALDGEPAPGEPPSPTPPPAAASEGVPPPDGEPRPEEVPLPPEAEAKGDAEPTPAEPIAPAGLPPEPTDAAPMVSAGRPAGPAEPPTSVSPAAAAARSGGGAAWLLGASNLVLLGALAWVLYTGNGRNNLADLRTKVAALEARPDASKLQGDVAALGQRLGAADAERQALAKSVAGLTTRLDAVAQQAQGATADAAKASSAAGAAQSDANRPAPTGDAAPATVGALAAVSAKLDGIETRVATLSTDQAGTAKAVADLPKPVPPDFGPTDAKLASLGAALAAVDAKANGTDARLNGFDAKVNAVDAKINGFDARANGIDARANALESKETEQAAALDRLRTAVADLPKVDLGPLQAATAALKSGSAEQAAALDKLRGTVADLPRVDLGPLQAATAALDKRVDGVEAQLSLPKERARAASIAVVAQSAGRAVADGRPYASDLDALKALGADPDALAKLQPLAAKGAPSVAALTSQWDAVRGDVLAAVRPAAAGGSVLDRLGSNALSLVQVRQVGAVKGDDPGAVVSQVDAALEAGDVAGALAAWGRLPPAGQDRSGPWASAARARLDAAGAAQTLMGRSIAALGKASD